MSKISIVADSNEYNNTNSGRKYDKDKWKKIMDTTQSNYANMIKRLSRRSKVSNFTLIYYSIFLIISPLTSKYFPDKFSSSLAEYFGIILSVIVLAYSLVNNNSNYNIRIYNIESSLNELKNLKRKLDTEELDECIKIYNELTDKTERRSDVDFFNTVRQLARLHEVNIFTKTQKKNSNKENNEDKIEVVKGYLSEINVPVEVVKGALEYIWYIILFLIPIAVFLICII
ncbi:SLATT domain-containing protein [Paraclostridium sordellii]|uniref:SLATT domain-containing protein n=1 Tax=Paraclostridium sordellii TaxID=1505 RepID=UPI000C75C6BE|nr:SLATT domain-containing protein [Paeniclostridium sordellii]AUN14045.1 hypothetical protein RSJ16_07350 [Paeniclostridium sordellii]MDU5019085.1 SLATT domain-containing protein [Clostridiales bacterium]